MRNRTFNLPSFFIGASILYGTPGLSEDGSVPNITGAFSVGTNSQHRAHFNSVRGAFYTSGSGTTRDIDGGSSTQATLMNFSASRISSVYNSTTQVHAAGLKMHFIIKYI